MGQVAEVCPESIVSRLDKSSHSQLGLGIGRSVGLMAQRHIYAQVDRDGSNLTAEEAAVAR